MAGPGSDTRAALQKVAQARQQGIIEAQRVRAAQAAQRLTRTQMTPEEKAANRGLLQGTTTSLAKTNKARLAAGRTALAPGKYKKRQTLAGAAAGSIAARNAAATSTPTPTGPIAAPGTGIMPDTADVNVEVGGDDEYV